MPEETLLATLADVISIHAVVSIGVEGQQCKCRREQGSASKAHCALFRQDFPVVRKPVWFDFVQLQSFLGPSQNMVHMPRLSHRPADEYFRSSRPTVAEAELEWS